MDQEQIDFFFLVLHANLKAKYKPDVALKMAVHELAEVFYSDDDRTPMARSAELSLKRLNGTLFLHEQKEHE